MESDNDHFLTVLAGIFQYFRDSFGNVALAALGLVLLTGLIGGILTLRWAFRGGFFGRHQFFARQRTIRQFTKDY
jgi:hypothetical protein